MLTPYIMSELNILTNQFYLTNPLYLIPASRLSILTEDQHATAAVDVIHLHRMWFTCHM